MIEEITEKLRKWGVCEILTSRGCCYIHRPDTFDNPCGKYAFANSGGDWVHYYKSFGKFWEAESHDFIKVT